MAPIFTGNRFGFGRGAAEAPPPKVTATGGTKSTDGGYVFHLFTPTSASNLVVTDAGGGLDIDYIVVGGGGGGGFSAGGGGGAGAFRYGTVAAVVGTHPIATGPGGKGG